MTEPADETTVVYRRTGPVATIELNRPDQRNALSLDLLADFHRALDELADDGEARVCVLRGRGPSFCAGFDLSRNSSSAASAHGDPWGDRLRLRHWIELGLRLWEAPTPIIAEIHGHCLAGGNLFILCSDLVYVSETCVIGWPKLPVGAGFLDGALAHLIGVRRAKELSFMVGSEITGNQAREWGLANAAHPEQSLHDDVTALASRIARAPRNILQIRKAAINRAVNGLSFRDAMLAGAEWDVIAHVDPAVDEVRGFVRERGMKEVIRSFESDDPPFATLRPGEAADGRHSRIGEPR